MDPRLDTTKTARIKETKPNATHLHIGFGGAKRGTKQRIGDATGEQFKNFTVAQDGHQCADSCANQNGNHLSDRIG